MQVTAPMVRPQGVTDREHEVLVLVAGHLTNSEIADRLFLSVRTVESHVSSLIHKLDVSDRRGLSTRANELGLLRWGRGGWPAMGNGFVGRAAETAALTDALARHAMVTVTGPGGVGKTRLTTFTAQQVAERRPDGGWFVDLSQVSDPGAVVPAVAAAVGVVDQPGRSADEALMAVLARADGVLVLDNCEHVLAAVERCVSVLVADCPEVTVVATSRARLGAAYEWVYEVPGLDEDDAVELFCDRALAAGAPVPRGAQVTAVCARLEGMALAIELAAARYPSLGLDGLAAAVGDPLGRLGAHEGSRQRSLRATIAWSVALLDDGARAGFAACSVFASWFTVAAARQVADPQGTESDMAELLARVADQHLLRVQVGAPTVYRFQDVVRQYAAELLADGAAEVEMRHARWVEEELTALATLEHDDAWCGTFDALCVEVRAALNRRAGSAELGERLAEELVQRGRLEEAQHRFELLAAATAPGRVRLLRLAAGVAAARLVGDEAMRLLDEASAAAVDAGDDAGVADALGWSVIYAALAPGIMAHPPGEDATRHRLDEARRRAPTGSPAEATVATAEAAWLGDSDPDALPAGRRAAAAAFAAGRPVVAAAALDGVCAAHLLRGEYTASLACVVERGALLDPEPADATTAYALNDYLLMGCEVSLAAGDLPGAAAYAGRLARLPWYRDDDHPVMARRLEVDVLVGDLAGAIAHGERFRDSWERAGRHRASTLGVGAYALSFAHGILGNDGEREEWQRITEYLLAGRQLSIAGPDTGWAPTLDAWLLLERGEADAAVDRLAADLADPLWQAWNTALWRPWYGAAWAEAAALAGLADTEVRLSAATWATRENPVAAALVRRAAALATGDRDAVAALAQTFDELGAAYQCARTVSLAR